MVGRERSELALLARIDRLESENARLREFALDLLHRYPEERLAYAIYGDEDVRNAVSANRRSRPIPSPHDRDESKAVVYYIDRGASVKIGTTISITSRMQTLSALPFDLLAVEPGGFAVERQRHAEFASLRIGQTELFSKSDALMEHITQLAEALPGPLEQACRINRRINPEAA